MTANAFCPSGIALKVNNNALLEQVQFLQTCEVLDPNLSSQEMAKVSNLSEAQKWLASDEDFDDDNDEQYQSIFVLTSTQAPAHWEQGLSL